MWQKPIIIIAAIVCVACAGGQQSQRQTEQNPELQPKPVADMPERASVTEYIDFLDKLKVAVERGDIREFSSQEYNAFQRIDRRLREELSRVDRIEDLGDQNKVRVFNLHQELQGVVIGDPENYLICRRDHRVGTNFKQTRCIPAGDFRRAQEENRRQLRQLIQPGPMPIPDQP